MDRRKAKREACFSASLALDTALAGGWDSLDKRYGEDDAEKVRECINDLIKELERRAGGS